MRKTACAAGWLAALALVGCVTPTTHPYEIEESRIGAPGVEAVGLLPLNVLVALPPELDGAARRVRNGLRRHIEASGREVVDFGIRESRRLWNESAGVSGGSGADGARMARFVERLRSQRPHDALVVPSLVYREGRIRAVTRNVDWDGVQRKLGIRGYVERHGTGAVMLDVRGKMPAVSLHLQVYDAAGERVFDSHAGLDLVHEIDIGTPGRQSFDGRPPQRSWRFRLKRRPLSDREMLREGIALAFEPWLEPPAQPTETVEASGGS